MTMNSAHFHLDRRRELKDSKDIICCIRDYGYYVSLASKLAQTYKKVYYSVPAEREYRSLKECIFGQGFKNVYLLKDPLHPDVLPEIDLFVYPDIGMASEQRHLRSLGKAVWGSVDATDLEIYRTLFLEMVEKLELPVAPYKVIRGLTALSEYLKTVKDKWVKVDQYRADMETWHHRDWAHSQRVLERLAMAWGGAKEQVVFVVQDSIKTPIECGYDGITVDGQYPKKMFQGYEKKNELYLGSVLPYEEMPKPTKIVNDAMSHIFKRLRYRNFMATEIRVKDDKAFFTDPTFRMPGQTGEQLLETCSNLADVIWYGANGEMKEPEFKYKFAVSASAHYDAGKSDEWGIVKVPQEIEQWVKFSHCAIINGYYHFPPYDKLDLGVVLGVGNSIKESLAHLRKNVDAFKGEPISFELDGFTDLLKSIRDAQAKGMKFCDEPIPEDKDILEYIV